MAVIKQVVGARTALVCTGFSTLAAGTYIVSDGAYNCSTNQPLDVIVEVNAQAAAPAGNKQIVVFIQESLDGTNFRTGPTSGTTTTDEPNLKFLGTVPMNSAGVTERGTFSVASVLGYVPYAFKVIIKNDLGAALSVGSIFTAEISSTVA